MADSVREGMHWMPIRARGCRGELPHARGACPTAPTAQGQGVGTVDPDASQHVDTGIELPGIAVADRQCDMASVAAVQRRIETLPAPIDPGLRPRMRDEYLVPAGEARRVGQPVDDARRYPGGTTECRNEDRMLGAVALRDRKSTR